MTVVVFGSVRGAPGVTTAAHLVAASLPSGAVLEADLDGGTLAARYGLGREPGLTTLAADRRRSADGWRDHAQSAGVPVVVGPDAPDSAEAVWASAGRSISAVLAAAAASFVVDVGRLRAGGPLGHLGEVTDLLVVLLRPVAEDVVALSHRLPVARPARSSIALVTVGPGPYDVAHLADELGVDALGSLPYDRSTAEVLSGRRGATRTLGRTSLVRSARDLAERIVGITRSASDRHGAPAGATT